VSGNLAMLVGNARALQDAKLLLEKFAACDLPILIEGETGTGKELAARAVHYASSRRALPFIPVNCGAIPDTLVENEFFGHKRGAYTDAREDQRGLASLAEGGALFLDEVDVLSAKGQVSLLRFLQDRVYTQIGGNVSRVANIRIIAASNSDISCLADRGAFRADLLFRLRILHVTMPPLRQRVEDIPELAEHFLACFSQRNNTPQKILRPEVVDWMRGHSWPGNVRELENLMYRACVLAEGRDIGIEAISEVGDVRHLGDGPPPVADVPTTFVEAKAAAISQFEVHYLSELMRRAQGNVSFAARLAGTERRYLGKLLKKHQIEKIPPRPA